MRVEMVGVQNALLQETQDTRFKRKDVAFTYAFALVSSEEIDWTIVNRAIIERWSLAGLRWIKARAWKIVEESGT